MVKTQDLKEKIEEIREKNITKFDEEVNKTISDFKKNNLTLKENKKEGHINLNIDTNKRTIFAIGGAALVVGSLSVFAYKTIKNKIKKKHTTKDKIVVISKDKE